MFLQILACGNPNNLKNSSNYCGTIFKSNPNRSNYTVNSQMCVLSRSKITQSGGSAFFVPIKFKKKKKTRQITV